MVRVSYLIPVKNMAGTIARCLDSVFSQKPYEVIVVDGASTDGTSSVVDSFGASVRHIYEDRGQGPSSAKNIGLQACAGDYVVAIDGDQWLPEDFHVTLLEVLRAATPDVVFHEEVIVTGTGFWSSCYLFERKLSYRTQIMLFSRPLHTYCENVGSTNIRILKRTTLNSVRGWNPKFKAFEDAELWDRLKKKIGLRYLTCRTLIIYSDETDITPHTELKRGMFYGCGLIEFAKKYRICVFLLFPFDLALSLVIFLLAIIASIGIKRGTGILLLRSIRSFGYTVGVLKTYLRRVDSRRSILV